MKKIMKMETKLNQKFTTLKTQQTRDKDVLTEP